MKRKALLIGYTGEGSEETTIDGVLLDLEKYKNYLMSIRGGAWYANEIKVLNTPTKAQLKQEILIASTADLTFTVFSGHGDFDDMEHGCRRFLLNKNEFILEKDLWNITKKQILICDSCAGYRSTSANEDIMEEKRISNLLETSHERFTARQKYEDWCKACDNQLIRLYAAQPDTYAEDQDGGVYTTQLISALKEARESISILEAHNIAKPNVESRTNGQKPTHSYPRVKRILPGAII